MLTQSKRKQLLGVEGCIVEGLQMSGDGSLLADLRLYKKQQQRCGICGQKRPWYNPGRGERHASPSAPASGYALGCEGTRLRYFTNLSKG